MNDNHDQRLKIMPITKNQPFQNLLKAIKIYTNQSHKRITIEYVLIEGINNSIKDSFKLIAVSLYFELTYISHL